MTCTENEEVEEEEESPAAGGEVDVNLPDRLPPPHTTGTIKRQKKYIINNHINQKKTKQMFDHLN